MFYKKSRLNQLFLIKNTIYIFFRITLTKHTLYQKKVVNLHIKIKENINY